MFQTHFRDFSHSNTKCCYVKLNDRDPINQLHILTLCMNFSSIDNKLIEVSIPEYSLVTYPEVSKAIQETLFPLLKGVHKSNAESIINTFMLIYADVK